MKNIKYLLLSIFCFLFISCGKAGIDKNGCFIDIDEAVKYAQKKKQNVLIVLTTGADEQNSQSFYNSVLLAEDFKQKIASKYSVVSMDFSEASYQKTVVKPDADKKTQKAAEKYADLMYKNAKIASMLNVQMPPAVYLMTKEQYLISEVIFENDITSVDDFASLLSKYDETCSLFNEKVRATEKGSIAERVAAIDDLYESTPENNKVFLEDLISLVIDLDKKNETGLVSKYLLAQANSKATTLYISGEVNEAIKCFVNICNNKYIEPAHKQQAYYMAAYLLAMSGSEDYNIMIDYLQKSIEADPESENVAGIEMFKGYVESVIEEGNQSE